jgi:DNA-binding response OmpR family regulator
MSRQRRPRVLVVDHLADAADSLAMLLRLWEYAPAVCYDGPAALETASVFRPSVVLLDVGMPGMDGCQVARRLRERPGSAHVVIIGVTGYGDEAHRNQARLAGVDHYLLKPTDPDRLRALLGRVAPRTAGLQDAETPQTSTRDGLMSTVVSPARSGPAFVGL